jgi:nitrous oxidase accessory protein
MDGLDSLEAFGTLAVVVGLAVIALALVGQGGAATSSAGPVDFDPGVPDEYEFTMPTAAGEATVDGATYESLAAAFDAADPGETVRLRGRFDTEARLATPNVTVVGVGERMPVINGSGEGDVLTIDAANVTLDGVWVRNSGYDPAGNDATIWINGSHATVRNSRVTETTFGIWVDGVTHATITNNTIVGRERITPLSYRGNGIQLWETSDVLVRNNRITDVRDGIYYSWADEVLAQNNTMWDLRYGVHYMYSDDCTLRNNVAFGNDAGYALMVSKRLHIVNNTAVNNSGRSGHGIMVKDIDHSVITDNDVVANQKGFFVYNSLNNTITENVVLENDIGVHLTAGSVRERVWHNTFINNAMPVLATIGEQVAWNTTGAGNYWSGAHVADVDNDGHSEVRYQPAGLVENVVARNPQANVFARSPAFDAVRLAESSIPLIEAPGVVDHHPYVRPQDDDWRRFYGSD